MAFKTYFVILDNRRRKTMKNILWTSPLEDDEDKILDRGFISQKRATTTPRWRSKAPKDLNTYERGSVESNLWALLEKSAVQRGGKLLSTRTQ